ncbi:pinensin family lanthipeptide [Longimicrobium sp.]|uniref:pinensin family lanthipeptide n=1 Tax=Longimicrobium sp. TaxID=2029185 RepID=UPI003B3A06B2
MRKISLNVNELRVESFETEKDDKEKQGTVHGHATQLLGCQVTNAGYTQCGQQCLSGWRPCQPTDAWTDGERMCYCAGGTGEWAC